MKTRAPLERGLRPAHTAKLVIPAFWSEDQGPAGEGITTNSCDARQCSLCGVKTKAPLERGLRHNHEPDSDRHEFVKTRAPLERGLRLEPEADPLGCLLGED